MPLAILSISTTVFNTCWNSLYATGILEFIFSVIFIFLPRKTKKKFDLFGIKILTQNLALILYTGLWCLLFALWAVINHQPSLDLMISNTNPDMWAYVRRFAGTTTDNLNFYGGSDSFTFDGNSACAFFLGSPKKFSSFLGSLIVYLFRDSSLGIAIFQGMLGGSLFICLFKEWCDSQSLKQSSKLILMTWALFAPPIYWLVISAYFSNTLFIIIVCLTLRYSRRIAIASSINTLENLVVFFSILVNVFAFYPAFLPIIIFTYLLVIFIYSPLSIFQIENFTKVLIPLMVVGIICGGLFYFLFPSQLGLYEVQKSLNLLDQHGSNFVPLNPWSLLQEKPKPMPPRRDFGWYINIIVGLLFGGFLGWKIWQQYQKNSDVLVRKNLLAGLVGVGLYIGYLLAFIPLEHTYRLMKIVISLIYPLAIFGLLPFILWSKKQLAKKSLKLRNTILILAIAHTVFHIYKVFELNPYPAGNLTLSNPSRLENISTLAIVGCQDVHVSQFYERLVGLQIARNYPQLQVNVVSNSANVDSISHPDLAIYGQTIPDKLGQRNACHFSI
ncbi:MAG: hypothetical protein Tsb0014_40970 [Pleurocapsa sp.]